MSVRVNGGDYLYRTANLPTRTSTTMCGWFRRQVDTNNYVGLLALEAVSNGTELWTVGFDVDGTTLMVSNGIAVQTFASSPAAGEWFFAAVRTNASGDITAKYARASDTGFTTATIAAGRTNPADRITVGSLSYGAFDFDGDVANARCWDADLTDAELWAEMWSPYAVRRTNLNFDWPLWSTTSLEDQSGNARTPTVAGTLALASGAPVPPFLARRSGLFVHSAAVTAQKIRPISDVTIGAWTPSTGTDLYAMLDEVAADDNDYISTTTASTCEVALGTATDPSIDTGHIVRYRAKGDASATLTVRLMAGATEIASWTHSPPPSSYTTFEQTLTTPQVQALRTNGGYSNARLRFST